MRGNEVLDIKMKDAEKSLFLFLSYLVQICLGGRIRGGMLPELQLRVLLLDGRAEKV
jgi:hypothetical protein